VLLCFMFSFWTIHAVLPPRPPPTTLSFHFPRGSRQPLLSRTCGESFANFLSLFTRSPFPFFCRFPLVRWNTSSPVFLLPVEGCPLPFSTGIAFRFPSSPDPLERVLLMASVFRSWIPRAGILIRLFAFLDSFPEGPFPRSAWSLLNSCHFRMSRTPIRNSNCSPLSLSPRKQSLLGPAKEFSPGPSLHEPLPIGAGLLPFPLQLPRFMLGETRSAFL